MCCFPSFSSVMRMCSDVFGTLVKPLGDPQRAAVGLVGLVLRLGAVSR